MKKPDPEKKCVAYYCDRCKERFADSRPLAEGVSEVAVERGVTIALPSVDEGMILFNQVDLCGKCVTALHEWRKGVV